MAFRNDMITGATSFMDMTVNATGLLSSSGENVVAIIDSAERVSGYRQRTTIQMRDRGRRSLDTLEVRVMKGQTVRQSPDEPLDASAQREVQDLVDWLRKRCPN